MKFKSEARLLALRATMETPSLWEMRKLRAVADYQLGRSVGGTLFPRGIRITRSNRTGKIKLIYLKNQHIATLRSHDGFISLTLNGAGRLLKKLGKKTPLQAIVKKGYDEIVGMGRNLFAKHVLNADLAIRPQNEVIIVDEGGKLVAIGRAVLSGEEMMCFKLGVAVKVRRGIKEIESSK